MNTLQSNVSEQINDNLKSLNQVNIIKENQKNTTIKDLTKQSNKKQTFRQSNLHKQNVKRMSLPMRQFQYGQPNARLRIKSQSEVKLRAQNKFSQMKQSLKFQRIPIKIIKDKILFQQFARAQTNLLKNSSQLDEYVENQHQENPQKIQISQQDLNLLRQQTKYQQLSAKQLLETKQRHFKPKLSIFDRYNYENYQNYNYKNPFVKHKYESAMNKNSVNNDLFNFPKHNKYKTHQGENKNLQIIFCQAKYEDFVRKTNQIFQKSQNQHKQSSFIENSLNLQSKIKQQANDSVKGVSRPKSLKINKRNLASYQNENSRRLFNSKNITQWNYSQYNIKALTAQSNKQPRQTSTQTKQISCKANIFLNKKLTSKSTLQKHLEEFKSLQKISQNQQKQRQSNILNKKLNLKTIENYSRTVFLDLIIHKFPFLKSLNKPFRNHLFKVIFELNSVDQNVKITIHDYLKLYRIFIYRDATIQEISTFIFRLMFKNQKIPSFNEGRNVLQQMSCQNKKKLQEAIQILFQFFNDIEQNSEKVQKKIHQNIYWLHLVIDLMLGL